MSVKAFLPSRVTRRSLVLVSGLGLMTGIFAACAPAATPTAVPLPAKPTEAPKAAVVAPTAVPAVPTAATAPTLAPVPSKPAAAPTLAPETKPAAATPAALAPSTAPAATLKMAFVPSSDSTKILATGQPLGDLLGKLTGLKFEVTVPTSYAAVIEAMGSGKVDVAWLAPFSYVLAKDKFGAEVIAGSVRAGSKTYVSQIITHVESGVNNLEDLKGKKFAFVDSASASGYLYPAALLKEKGFDPKTYFSEVVNAGGHDKVVIAVYNKQVAGGATFGRSSMDPNAPLTDARGRVTGTLPDVLQKVKIIAETDPIPNDTVSVRKGLDKAVIDKLKTGLLQIGKEPDGKKLLGDLYQIDGLAETTDADYEPIRRKAQLVGLNIESSVIPAAPAPTVAAPASPPATKP